MYYYLNGIIVELYEDFGVIDVNGVGYKFLLINKNDFSLGEKTLVYTLHIVREDDELFVGFKSLDEKKVFQDLINVKGIGPKAAAQIILDMKGSIQTSSLDVISSPSIKLNKEQEDAKSVLKTLGFKAKDIDEVLNKLPVTLSASDYVNEVLRRIGK